MSELNKVFDKIYVINLSERKDRLKDFSEMMESHSIDFEVFKAVNGNYLKFDSRKLDDEEVRYNKYAEALVRTTHKILLDSKQKGHKKILIFEDDALIRDVFLRRFDNFKVFDSKAEWDMFFFGYRTLVRPDKTKYHRIKKVNGCNACHCYAINSTAFDELIELTKVKNGGLPIDGIYVDKIQPKGTTYCTSIPQVGQKEGYSNIGQNILKNKDL